MLGKLIKYDMKCIGRILLPAILALFGMTALGAFSMKMLIINSEKLSQAIPFMNALLGLFTGLSFLSVFAFEIICIIMVFYRYYTNLFTDEGYLTFTLPVKTGKIILAKYISGFIWILISTICTVACFLALIVFGTNGSSIVNLDIFKGISEGLHVFYGIDGSGFTTLLIVLSLLILVFFQISILYFSITIGSIISKRYKVLAAIGVYYGFSVVYSIITTVTQLMIPFTSMSSSLFETVGPAFYENVLYTVDIVMAVYAGVSLIFGVIAAVVNCYLIKNKLNLN